MQESKTGGTKLKPRDYEACTFTIMPTSREQVWRLQCKQAITDKKYIFKLIALICFTLSVTLLYSIKNIELMGKLESSAHQKNCFHSPNCL